MLRHLGSSIVRGVTARSLPQTRLPTVPLAVSQRMFQTDTPKSWEWIPGVYEPDKKSQDYKYSWSQVPAPKSAAEVLDASSQTLLLSEMFYGMFLCLKAFS